MKKEQKKGYVLYTNSNGTTYHVKDGDSISLDEIKQQMALKESTADTKLDLITYKACIDKGLCKEGIKIFGRILRLDDEEIKDVSFTQREFDNIVSKYGKLILDSNIRREAFQLTTREAWKDHEGIISENSEFSFCYAKDVLKGRFEEGEELISQSAHYSYLYAKYVIKGRFDLGESMIIQNAEHSYLYARYIIKGRFELGEEAISKDAEYSYLYAIKGRFELGEEAISKDAEYSYLYARYIIKGRFELGEEAIAKNDYYLRQYNEFLETNKLTLN